MAMAYLTVGRAHEHMYQLQVVLERAAVARLVYHQHRLRIALVDLREVVPANRKSRKTIHDLTINKVIRSVDVAFS